MDHRSEVQEQTSHGWREACPLPFYGIRKRCECGRKFWRESSYVKHWRIENALATQPLLADVVSQMRSHDG